MLRRMKKITALALSCLVLAGTTNLQVFAAVYEAPPGTVAGTAAYASLTTSSTSATAKTTYARSGASIKAMAKIFYLDNGRCYGTHTESTSSAGGTSATATKKISAGQVIGHKGEHWVQVNAESYFPVIKSGTIPNTYTLI